MALSLNAQDLVGPSCVKRNATQRFDGKLEYLANAKSRKLEYFGHIMTKNTICLSWQKDLRAWTGVTSTTLFRIVVSRGVWNSVIANILRG